MAITPAPLAEDRLTNALFLGWGMRSAEIQPLHLGHASETWTYSARAEGARYFLKLRSEMDPPRLAIVRHLAEAGIPAVAPVPAVSGDLSWRVDRYHLVVYPWIDGAPIDSPTPMHRDWSALGTAMKQVQEAAIPQALVESLPSQQFLPWGSLFLPQVQEACESNRVRGTTALQELATLWSKYGTDLAELYGATRTTGATALALSPALCLCHGDLQPSNILKSSSGMIHLIDWDTSLYSVPEQDLMFVAPENRRDFEAGYGPLALRKPILAYLKADWHLQEIFDCLDRLLFQQVEPEEMLWALRLLARLLPRICNLLRGEDCVPL